MGVGIIGHIDWRPTIEFPDRHIIEKEKLKNDSLVKILSFKSDKTFRVYCKVETYLGSASGKAPFLGELEVSSHEPLFRKFLDKYARCWKGRTPEDRFWEIELGMLCAAYRCYKKSPRELENIIKVAKTKKEFYILVGMD